MPHAEVEKGHKEAHRPPQAAAHSFELCVIFTAEVALFRLRGKLCPIATFFHGGDDVQGGHLPLVIADHHGAQHQIHADLLHAIKFSYGALHMGGAGGAGHARYGEILFHLSSLPSKLALGNCWEV